MKISFIGAGRVGSSAAFSVLHSLDTLKEIVMVDIVQDLAEGEALDLTHAAYAMERGDIRISGTANPAATKDTDIYVMTAGIARKKGQLRQELVETNAGIVCKVAKEMAKEAGLRILYTNCRNHNTSFKILAHLLRVQARGASLDELFQIGRAHV